MNRQEYAGIGFGFTLVLIWLILLTGFMIYDKIKEEVKVDTNYTTSSIRGNRNRRSRL